MARAYGPFPALIHIFPAYTGLDSAGNLLIGRVSAELTRLRAAGFGLRVSARRAPGYQPATSYRLPAGYIHPRLRARCEDDGDADVVVGQLEAVGGGQFSVREFEAMPGTWLSEDSLDTAFA